MNQWLKIEFYAQLPDGQAIVDINTQEVAFNLAKTFGFRYIDAISMVVAADRGDRYPSMLPPPDNRPIWVEGGTMDQVTETDIRRFGSDD